MQQVPRPFNGFYENKWGHAMAQQSRGAMSTWQPPKILLQDLPFAPLYVIVVIQMLVVIPLSRPRCRFVCAIRTILLCLYLLALQFLLARLQWHGPAKHITQAHHQQTGRPGTALHFASMASSWQAVQLWPAGNQVKAQPSHATKQHATLAAKQTEPERPAEVIQVYLHDQA